MACPDTLQSSHGDKHPDPKSIWNFVPSQVVLCPVCPVFLDFVLDP